MLHQLQAKSELRRSMAEIRDGRLWWLNATALLNAIFRYLWVSLFIAWMASQFNSPYEDGTAGFISFTEQRVG